MRPSFRAVGQTHAKQQTFENPENKRQMYGSQSTHALKCTSLVKHELATLYIIQHMFLPFLYEGLLSLTRMTLTLVPHLPTEALPLKKEKKNNKTNIYINIYIYIYIPLLATQLPSNTWVSDSSCWYIRILAGFSLTMFVKPQCTLDNLSIQGI